MRLIFALILWLLISVPLKAQHYEQVDIYAKEIEKTIIDLRRSFHQFPELSNREFETSKKIADLMTRMGFVVETGIAKTGVVALWDTGREGPTVALRADIDGLPVTEDTGLAFASKEKGEYLGDEVGVMHACGHDAHIAMLIGAASLLKKMSPVLKGKIVFVFQPAEEGPPPGEEGGAALMIKEGLIEKYGIDVFFGQHIRSNYDVGTIRYKVGGIMAAANKFTIKVKGEQTHGSRPWRGIDPITVSAQIIMGVQTIVSRQMDITNEPVVISFGKIHSGVRNNIIPAEVEMVGTIRTFDVDMLEDIKRRMNRTVSNIAASAGATAELIIEDGYPVTSNDANLTRQMLPSLNATMGEENVIVSVASTGAEDFSYFAQKVPSLYYLLGAKPKDISSLDASKHHSPGFYIDESALIYGVKSLTNLTIDYLNKNQ